MKNIILLLFISQIGISQSVKLEGVTYIMPSTEGDIECVLLTKKDFQELQVALTQLNNGNNTKSLVSEKDFLSLNAIDAKYLADRYNKTNSNRNGYSIIEIGRMFGLSDTNMKKPNSRWKTEKDIAELIFIKISELK